MTGITRVFAAHRRTFGIIAAHRRTFAAIASGAVCYIALLPSVPEPTRSIAAWDVFGVVFLSLISVMMLGARPADMPANARAQSEGEWSIFWIILVGAVLSFAVLISAFPGTKELAPNERRVHVAFVVGTLAVTWLVTQIAFAVRYAHEYYAVAAGSTVRKGLEFPGGEDPNYGDFVYFSFVLGMTFQVSDVEITARSLRRLATVHGLFGFVFNTVLLALSVNLAANLL